MYITAKIGKNRFAGYTGYIIGGFTGYSATLQAKLIRAQLH